MGVRNKNRRMLLTAFVVLLAMGCAIRIEERLDLSALPEADVFVKVTFAPGDIIPASIEGLRQDLCQRTLTSPISSCYGTLDEANRKAFFQVRIEDISDSILDIGQKDERLTLTIGYHPLFTRLPLDMDRWSIKVTMPDRQRLSFTGTKPTRLDVRYTFPVLAPLPLDVELGRSELQLGQMVALTTLLPANRPRVVMCVHTLANDTHTLGTKVVKGCIPTYFGTSEEWMAGEYEVRTTATSFYLDGVALGTDTDQLTLERLVVAGDDVVVPVSVVMHDKTGDIWFVGEPVSVHLTSPDPDSRCSLHLEDVHGRMSVTRAVPCNGEARLVTLDIPPGDYIMEIRESSSGRTVTTRPLRILPSSTTADPEVEIERGDYAPGETVIANLNLPGMACRSELVSAEGYMVAMGEQSPCTKVLLDTPQTLRSGTYTLLIKVLSDDVVVATARKQVVILRPMAAEDSDRSRYCPGGVFALTLGKLRCIDSGQRCDPTSVQLPGCLCFTGVGTYVGVCTHTQKCADDGCQELGLQPYIIARDVGNCMVRKGLESFPCIGYGEVCSGFCACTSGPQVVDNCYFGEACTPDGCVEPDLVLKLTHLDPQSVRADALANTQFELTVLVTYKGNVLADKPTFSLDLGGSPIELGAIESRGEGLWRITGSVSIPLAPGKYPLLLTGRHGDAVYSVRSHVEVWFPRWMADVAVTILDAPTTLSTARLENGERLDVKFRAFDASGTELTDLIQDDFTFSLGGRVLNIDSLEYDRARGHWRATLLGLGEFEESDVPLSVQISHLGMDGMAERSVTLVEQLPARIVIREVTPKEVFQAQTIWGFDMTMDLVLQGDIQRISATVRGKDYDVLVTPYQESFGASMVNVRFCPDIIATGEERVTLRGSTPDGTEVTASETIIIVPNPGGWLNNRCPTDV